VLDSALGVEELLNKALENTNNENYKI